MRLDREKFWKGYHKSFDAYGPTTQKTVNALNAILDKFETETRLKFVSWNAYALATAYHETGINGNHFVPVREGKAKAGTTAWGKYQSKYWSTGFYGRGLVQVTHEANYLKVGELLGLGHKFVEDPDALLDINFAYEAMIMGMVEGIYRADKKGKRHNLARYLKADDASLQDYVNAREIINGDVKRNGLMIANYAEKFEHILISASVSTGQDAAKPDAAEPHSIDLPAGSPAGLSEQTPTIQNAENIINAGDMNQNPAPVDKTLDAPPKDGSTATSTKMTIAGIVVPTFLVTFIKSVQDLVQNGYVSASDIGSTVLTFIRENQKYVFLLIALLIVLLIIKKLLKQVTFWISMLTHAIPGWNNVTVTPSEAPTQTTLFGLLKK